MSLVKNIIKDYRQDKIDLFIELVMVVGGTNDLYKRQRETEVAISYLELKPIVETGLVNIIKKELRDIKKGMVIQWAKIESLRERQYHLQYFKKLTKFRKYYWEGNGNTFYLNEEETQMIKDYITANYHTRKPFPYEIETCRNDNYCI